MKKGSITKLASLILALSMVLSLFGCASSNQQQATSSGNTASTQAAEPTANSSISSGDTEKSDNNGPAVEIEALGWKSEATEGFKELSNTFNAQNPGIKLTFTTSPDFYQTLQGRIAAGNPPDLMGVWSGNYHRELIKGGNLIEITSQPFLGNIRENVLEFQKMDGKIWSMPIDMAAIGFIYNKDVFAKVDAEVPKTWDEFKAVCEKIKATGVTPVLYCGQDAWTLNQAFLSLSAPLVYGADPQFDLNAVTGSKKYTDSAWEKGINYFTEVKDTYANKDVMSLNYSTGNQMIAEGKAAMVMQGIWCVSSIKEYNPNANLGFFTPPLGDKPFMILGADFTLGVSSKSKHQAEALKVLEFMSTKQASDIWTSKVKTLSCVKDSAMDFDNVVKDVKAIADAGAQIYPIPNHMWFSLSVDTDVPAMLQEVNAGKLSSKDALKRLDQLIRTAYKDYMR